MKSKEDIAKEVRDYIIKFLYSADYPFIKKEENVIYADKAFKVSSAIHYCVDKKVSPKAYISQLIKYHEGRVELLWENGILKVKIIPGENISQEKAPVANNSTRTLKRKKKPTDL